MSPTRFRCATSLISYQWVDNLAEWLRRWPAKPLGYAREGSNPSVVAIFYQAQWSRGAMDSAPDFESGGWGFESLRDRYFTEAIKHETCAIGLVVKYLVANEVPRVRFPDGAYLAPVAQLVAPRSYVPMVQGSSPCTSTFGLILWYTQDNKTRLAA